MAFSAFSIKKKAGQNVILILFYNYANRINKYIFFAQQSEKNTCTFLTLTNIVARVNNSQFKFKSLNLQSFSATIQSVLHFINLSNMGHWYSMEDRSCEFHLQYSIFKIKDYNWIILL